MVAKQDDAKMIIKELLSEGLGKLNSRTIFRDGLEIRITKTDDGFIKFDLPDQGKTFVLMSGRLYERQYNQQNADLDKPEDEPGKKEGLAFTEIQEPAALVEQLDYQGKVEKVDPSIFKHRMVCGCGQVRFIKGSDLFQVQRCKPCTKRQRQERRRAAGSCN